MKKTLTDEDVAGSIANAESYLGLMAKGHGRPGEPEVILPGSHCKQPWGTDHSVPRFCFHGKEALVMPHSLTHPERLTITGPQGETYQGGDQEWYRDLWQRRRLRAHHRRRSAVLSVPDPPRLRPMAPAAARTQAGFLRYMEALWPYVTPGARGLDKPESLVLGCRSFALSRGCRLQGQVLEIPAQREARPSLDQCRAIRRPVPGPGLSRGLPQLLPRSPQNLDSWHWVPLTAMTEGESVLLCTILVRGRRG